MTPLHIDRLCQHIISTIQLMEHTSLLSADVRVEEVKITDDRGGTGCWLVEVEVSGGRVFRREISPGNFHAERLSFVNKETV